MKNTTRFFGIIAIAVVIAFTFVTCNNDTTDTTGGNLDLSGNITISPNTGVTIGIELTATYSGSEIVAYQWKKDVTNVGTNSRKFTPDEVGTYTVTISANGYKNKTSASVVITTPTVSTPIASLMSGTYTGSQDLTFSTNTEGASIYYAMDGTVPSVNSIQYTDVITISETTTFKVIAIKGMDKSDILTVTYTINIPTINITGITSKNGSVTLYDEGGRYFSVIDTTTIVNNSATFNLSRIWWYGRACPALSFSDNSYYYYMGDQSFSSLGIWNMWEDQNKFPIYSINSITSTIGFNQFSDISVLTISGTYKHSTENIFLYFKEESSRGNLNTNLSGGQGVNRFNVIYTYGINGSSIRFHHERNDLQVDNFYGTLSANKNSITLSNSYYLRSGVYNKL